VKGSERNCQGDLRYVPVFWCSQQLRQSMGVCFSDMKYIEICLRPFSTISIFGAQKIHLGVFVVVKIVKVFAYPDGT